MVGSLEGGRFQEPQKAHVDVKNFEVTHKHLRTLVYLSEKSLKIQFFLELDFIN